MAEFQRQEITQFFVEPEKVRNSSTWKEERRQYYIDQKALELSDSHIDIINEEIDPRIWNYYRKL